MPLHPESRTQPVCAQPTPHPLTTGLHTRVYRAWTVFLNVGAGRDLRLFNPHKSRAGKQRSPKGALSRSHRSLGDLQEPQSCLALGGGAPKTTYPNFHQLWNESSTHGGPQGKQLERRASGGTEPAPSQATGSTWAAGVAPNPSHPATHSPCFSGCKQSRL